MVDRIKAFPPLLLAVALGACDRAPSGDKPGKQDSASAGQVVPARPDFPDTDIGRLLAQHMTALGGHGRDAEEKYQASLATLRARAAEATRQLVESYANIDQSRYFRRWAVLETIRELGDSSSVGLAIRVAESPLPPERFTDDSERASQDEELRIRVKAVEIIGALAANRVPGADSALLRLVQHSDLGVRRTAIRGYLAAGGPAEQARRTEELRRLVATGDSALITLATTEIRRVPHPDMPAQFDLGRGRSGKSAPRVVKP